MAQAETGTGRRAARGPAVAIGAAILLIAVVMLVAMLISRPWENNGGLGDPTLDPPSQEQRLPDNSQPGR